MPGMAKVGTLRRLIALFLAMAFCANHSSAWQPKKTDGDSSEGITLATDRAVGQRLLTARDYVKAESWLEAARLLQTILDAKEDVFVALPVKDREGRASTRWTSARSEAERLLGQLPKKGLEVYEFQFGPVAGRMLVPALEKNDGPLLLDVARRYSHTRAGQEALLRLATQHLDRGRAGQAALAFHRLLQSTDVTSPATLFQAALAFQMAGDGQAVEQTWKRLVAAVGMGGLNLGQRRFSVDELRRELDRRRPAQSAAADWLLPRGDPRRSSQAHEQPPVLDIAWQAATAGHETSRQWLETALAQSERSSRPEPLLPAFTPLVIGNRIVYRSHSGVHAIDRVSGQPIWSTTMERSLDTLVAQPGAKVQLEDWLQSSYRGFWNMLVANEFVGQLSSDGGQIYAVDDLPVTPADLQQQTDPQAPRLLGPLKDACYHNFLCALDATTGALRWRIGGRGAGLLQDAFFFGPPLPLHGELYVLVQKANELRLVCLDPRDGGTVWSQRLGNVKDARDSALSPLRRWHAAGLAYADGILVCPTQAGTILAFDLFGRGLLWAHSYRDGTAEETIASPFAPISTPPCTGTATVIHEGRVVFTAADSPGVRCLDLRDGSLLWHAGPAVDDAYLAGVKRDRVLIVGNHHCRALRLADGRPAWKCASGGCSGQGLFVDDQYFLPSRRGTLAILRVDDGKLSAEIAGPAGVKLGNLVFAGSELVAQNGLAITAFKQSAPALAAAQERLNGNPREAATLVERGTLRLDRGQWQQGTDDLRSALAAGLPRALEQKTRRQLYDAIARTLHDHPATGDQYLEEHHALGRQLVAREPDAKRRQMELEHLALTAQVRAGQGRVSEAFQAYRDLYALAGNTESLVLPDDPLTRVRADRWVAARIADLTAAATPEQRRLLMEEVARTWKGLESTKSIDELGRFVAQFGDSFKEGREAALLLAEKLADQKERFLEAEMLYLRLARTAPERGLQAQALDGLARLWERRGLLDDALAAYRLLEQDHGGAPLRDGQTGSQRFQAISRSPQFAPLLAGLPIDQLEGRMVAKELPGVAPKQAYFVLQPEGEWVLPYFKQHQLVVDLATGQLRLLDAVTRAEHWRLSAGLMQLRGAAYDLRLQLRFSVVGHIVVMNLGFWHIGIDAVAGRLLWRSDVVETPVLSERFLTAYTPNWGPTVDYTSQEGNHYYRTVGKSIPSRPSQILVQKLAGLAALDPVTGQMLWSRPGSANESVLFGDDEHLFVARAGTLEAFRTLDGASAPLPNARRLPTTRLQTHGRHVLVSEADAAGSMGLHYHDPLTGKDLWGKALPAGSVVLRSHDPTLAGYVEADGHVVVMDLRTLRTLLDVHVEPRHAEKLQDAYLVGDRRRFFLALNVPADPEFHLAGEATVPATPSGLPVIPVNGYLYAFDRATQGLLWYNAIQLQNLLVDQLDATPVLIFTSTFNRLIELAGGNRSAEQSQLLLSIDKLTGKRLFEKKSIQGGVNWHTFVVNPRAGTVDLVAHNVLLRHAAGGK
jgi:outer membrane protein assembly factor BamB/tetratricopeptide (TPR) repeat protein